MRIAYSLSIILMLFNISCKDNHLDVQNIMSNKLIGYNMVIQDTVQSYVLGSEVYNIMDKMDYKLISYVCPQECLPCELRLQKWNKILKEFFAIPHVQIGFLMFVNTLKKDEVIATAIRDNFKYPVAVSSIISKKDKIYKLLDENKIPFTSILLDSNNNLLLIGDILNNPKTKNIFLNYILDDTFGEDRTKDSVDYEELYLRQVGVVEIGDSVNQIFHYRNKSPLKLHLQDLIPSCDCLSYSNLDSIVMPDGSFNLEVSYLPNTDRTYFKKYIDVYFEEIEKPCRFMLQGYVKHK